MLHDQQCRKMPVNRAPVVSVHWGGQTAEVGEMPFPVLILSTPIERVLNECLGLLTGQLVPIFRCRRECHFNADRHVS